LAESCLLYAQALLDLNPDNHFMSPFFSACLLEQKDHATRIVKGWLQSQGLASALCAPREVCRSV
jgi:hypothetical protein